MSGVYVMKYVRVVSGRKQTWEVRKLIDGYRYFKYFHHQPTMEEVREAINEFKARNLAKIFSVERLKSGKYRLSKMVNRVRYQTTVKELPSRKEAELIFERLKENKPPRRSWSKALTKQQTYVYFIENTENHKIKIGLSTDVNTRLRDLKTACGAELVLLGTLEHKHLEEAFKTEHDLHTEFSEQRIYVNGTTTEWFDGIIKNNVLHILEAAS